jgi:hypothetical protein
MLELQRPVVRPYHEDIRIQFRRPEIACQLKLGGPMTEN